MNKLKHPRLSILKENEVSDSTHSDQPQKAWLRVDFLRGEGEQAHYFAIECFENDQAAMNSMHGIKHYLKKYYWCPIKVFDQNHEKTILIDLESAQKCLEELGFQPHEVADALKSQNLFELIFDKKVKELQKQKNLSEEEAEAVLDLFENHSEITLNHAIAVSKISAKNDISIEEALEFNEFVHSKGIRIDEESHQLKQKNVWKEFCLQKNEIKKSA